MGIVRVYGAPVTTWRELKAHEQVGDTSLAVKACQGWAQGDSISVAPTGAAEAAEEFTLTAVKQVGGGGCTVGISGAIASRHNGGATTTTGLPVHAEVVNMTR